jgi:hypothetical protein
VLLLPRPVTCDIEGGFHPRTASYDIAAGVACEAAGIIEGEFGTHTASAVGGAAMAGEATDDAGEQLDGGTAAVACRAAEVIEREFGPLALPVLLLLRL